MEQSQVMDKLIELSNRISGIEGSVGSIKEDIKTLFKDTSENRDIIKEVHAVALSLKEITVETRKAQNDITHMQEKISVIEEDKRMRYRAVWQSFITASIGAIVGFLVNNMIGR